MLYSYTRIHICPRALPSFEEIKKQSLHSRLLNMEWPYPEIAEEYEINKEIEQEMKRFFMPKVGVYFPSQVYKQQRFDRGKSQGQEVMTFYPTYTTTQRMFKHIKKFQTIFLYGKWGIGKSQSIILYCMLSIYVNFYFYKYPDTQQEFKKFYRLLEAKKAVYWTISQDETMDSLIEKAYYQKPWLWKKDENLKIEKGDYQKYLKKYDQDKQTANRSKLKNSAGIAFFDQINSVASVKRRLIQLQKQIQKKRQQANEQMGEENMLTKQVIRQKKGMLETLEKQSNYLNDLIKEVKATSTVRFYNSSSNIERSLLTDKQANLRTMNLYSIQHGGTRPTPFNYQGLVSRRKNDVGMLELAQFFTSIMQEFTSFSEDVLQQWESQSKEGKNAREQFLAEIQEEFINTKCNSIPNAALIVLMFKQSQSEEIKLFEKQIDIPKTIAQCKSAKELKKVILKVISTLNNNSKETLKAKLNHFLEILGNIDTSCKRETKIYIYQQALKASQRYEDLPKEQQPLSFEFRMKAEKYLQNIANNISIKSRSQDNNIFDVFCSLSPKAYRETIIEKAMRKYNLIIKDIINQEIFSILADKQNGQLGKEFLARMAVNVFDQRMRIDLYREVKSADNQKYQERIQFPQTLRKFNQKSSSFADKFIQAFKNDIKVGSSASPEQFYYSGQQSDSFNGPGYIKYKYDQIHQNALPIQVIDLYSIKFRIKREKITQPIQRKISFVVVSLKDQNQYLTKKQG